MDFSDVLSLLGFVVLLVGLFANRLNPLLARNRRLLIIIGALTVVLTVGPEIVSGLIDGYKAGSTR
jgi:hypothetical protein